MRVDYAAQPPSVELEQNLSRAYKPEKGDAHGEPTIAVAATYKAAWHKPMSSLSTPYTTAFETHSLMETHATIAAWEGDHKLTL